MHLGLGQIGALGRLPSAAIFLFAAPAITLTSPITDNTPEFEMVHDDIREGDLVRFQYSTSAAFAGAVEVTNTIDAAEFAAKVLDFSTGPLANNTWYFRARIERLATMSQWSNVVSETIAV